MEDLEFKVGDHVICIDTFFEEEHFLIGKKGIIKHKLPPGEYDVYFFYADRIYTMSREELKSVLTKRQKTIIKNNKV